MCAVNYESQYKCPRHSLGSNQQAFRRSQNFEDEYGTKTSTCGKKRIRNAKSSDLLTPTSIIQPTCTEVSNLPITPPRRRIPFQNLYFQQVVTGIPIGNLCGAITLAWLNSWETVDYLLKGNVTGKVFPGLTAHFMKYARFVIEKAHLSAEVVQTALFYVYRLRRTCPHPIYGEPSSEARIFIVALMLANKYVEDVSYTLPAWTRMSAISSNELKLMELEFLKKLDFKLHVSRDDWTEFETFMSDVVNPVVDKLNLC